jgi:hypothetical protein
MFTLCGTCRLTSNVVAPTILLNGTVTLLIRAPLRQLPKSILASLHLLLPLIPLLLSTSPVLVLSAGLAVVVRAFMNSAKPRVAFNAGEHVADLPRLVNLARGAALGSTPAKVRVQAEHTHVFGVCRISRTPLWWRMP